MDKQDEIIKHVCPVCLKEYTGEWWKKKCYDCWKDWKYSKRIQIKGYKENIYICHPSVTAEELTEWIKKNKIQQGWGVQEWNGEGWKPFKIWVDNTNFD